MADRIGFFHFARLVVDAIEATGLEYLIGGSVAVWAWGEPRTTMDVDLVVLLPATHVRRLAEELTRRSMLLPPEIILDVLLQPEGDLPIHAIHGATGFKADIYLLRAGDELRASSLARRRQVDFDPPLGRVYVHAPEDLILNKVQYYAISRQTKHIRDLASILITTGDGLDWVYLNHWIVRLGLADVWSVVRQEIDRLSH